MKRSIHTLALVSSAFVLTACNGIYSAVQSGNVKTVKEYLAEGYPPNSLANGEPHIPLCTAVIHEQLEVAKVLLDANSHTETECVVDGSKRSPLAIAVLKGNAQMVDLLLAHGADAAKSKVVEAVIDAKSEQAHALVDDFLKRVQAKQGADKAKAAADAGTYAPLAIAAHHRDVATL